MAQDFGFKFGGKSTAFGDIADIHYRENAAPISRRQGKPVKVFYTHGLQVVGIPDELVAILGPQAIRRANGTKVTLAAHFETADAFYLLRIESVAHMALPR
ncbi:MAG: hypothetical protein Q7K57_01410 [Burkholderiaceae bacterium]|nr:hypothetical protein [Burkholderiaceae bacterium]